MMRQLNIDVTFHVCDQVLQRVDRFLDIITAGGLTAAETDEVTRRLQAERDRLHGINNPAETSAMPTPVVPTKL